jgi:hypothetical protein
MKGILHAFWTSTLRPWCGTSQCSCPSPGQNDLCQSLHDMSTLGFIHVFENIDSHLIYFKINCNIILNLHLHLWSGLFPWPFPPKLYTHLPPRHAYCICHPSYVPWLDSAMKTVANTWTFLPRSPVTSLCRSKYSVFSTLFSNICFLYYEDQESRFLQIFTLIKWRSLHANRNTCLCVRLICFRLRRCKCKNNGFGHIWREPRVPPPPHP